ncbi:hypothetical protein WICPIJ_005149 [Wickerhamomyces pijperi]|uniref:Uncharacterized protein n=1 Tax=Wickerhamomyces pijperi TaxID=599730 RepID=A0A9P8Q4G3_WICPI|nr:hypothetical protein WICPIJ_005149 [Wickerhamomyces pijperi]
MDESLTFDDLSLDSNTAFSGWSEANIDTLNIDGAILEEHLRNGEFKTQVSYWAPNWTPFGNKSAGISSRSLISSK